MKSRFFKEINGHKFNCWVELCYGTSRPVYKGLYLDEMDDKTLLRVRRVLKLKAYIEDWKRWLALKKQAFFSKKIEPSKRWSMLVHSGLDYVLNPANGKRYTCKAAYERAVKEAGCVIIGNEDPLKHSKPKNETAYREDLRKDIAQVLSNYGI